MNFRDLISDLVSDTLGGPGAGSIELFGPELILCGTIVLLLLLRVFNLTKKIDPFYIVLAGSAAALWYTWQFAPTQKYQIFTGMLVFDPLTSFIRGFLMFFVFLFTIFTKISGISDREDSADFYSLVLGATIGMCLMAEANHLLIVFLGVEMASVPSYILAGMLKHDRKSSEAALKYAIYGAGTAGIMLYGISLLSGVLGSAHLPTMSMQLSKLFQQSVDSNTLMVLVLGSLMVLVGLAFKLSAVPFHFWCPDVFEGAAAEVAAFLSVASKAAALALLIRLAVGFGYISDTPPVTTDISPSFSSSDIEALEPVRDYLAKLIGFLAIITCTFGNLAAYAQTNIKRLLAYSTIAHAGYMMMPVAAAVVMMGDNKLGAERAISSLVFYLAIYLFMNLGAFAIVAFLRNKMGSEEISDYTGLVHRCPGLVVCFTVILFSLVGLPPLAGFAAKFTIFYSLVVAWTPLTLTLLVVGCLNTVISLYYYLRIVKIMTFDPPAESRAEWSLPIASVPGFYVMIITLPVLILGVYWGWLYKIAKEAASQVLGY